MKLGVRQFCLRQDEHFDPKRGGTALLPSGAVTVNELSQLAQHMIEYHAEPLVAQDRMTININERCAASTTEVKTLTGPLQPSKWMVSGDIFFLQKIEKYVGYL